MECRANLKDLGYIRVQLKIDLLYLAGAVIFFKWNYVVVQMNLQAVAVRTPVGCVNNNIG